MEREDPDRPRRLPEHALEPLAHLPGGLVGEGDREDLVRLDTTCADQVRDAIGEDPRLSGARAGDDQQRPFRGQNGLPLRLVEVGQVALGRRDCHAPMLAAAYQRTVSST
jgi:hypothetical protein